ncbi:MAG: hypothetical protein HKO65_02635, partial [Gemmatimonadetes bacterium]|nr:hypothetical protein [Gemmatimonadota bacterium]
MRAPSRSPFFRAVWLVALPLLAAPGSRPLAGQAPDDVQQALSSMEFRHIGPANVGGRVSAIVGIPGDPSTYWVGGADGGVYKTTNGG